ncbi:nuclear pore complex protein NUP96-like [Chenopodium quinoa]|uniref:nuclear pore complex protein NUP96-like n=1 Tax=Chenopodium quinoa TaxID=63459 RepID=UPI000B77F273|nr:nuclear pore complex protein NUP96-like [Chenopodium quinoa]
MEFDIFRDIQSSSTRPTFDCCSAFQISSPYKKRKTIWGVLNNGVLPVLRCSDYYTEPSMKELAALEGIKPGYCSKIRDFVVGRTGFGSVMFLGETDVRGLDLAEIVKFNRNEIVVYEDESIKPDVGEGLNKPAVVSLILKFGKSGVDGGSFCGVVDRLRESSVKQGAEFMSYDPLSGEWKFRVRHFSRFGLSLDDEDDIVMDDADDEPGHDHVEMDDDVGVGVGGGGEDEGLNSNGFDIGQNEYELSHSLPAHLGLDPARMREMKMLMFSGDGDEDESYDDYPSHEKQSSQRDKFPLYNSGLKVNFKPSPPPPRKTPVPLLEYKSNGFDVNAPGTLLLAQQTRSPLRVVKPEGFKLDPEQETPVSGYHSRNIVDAGLFMGRSFRVGWGPNGVLIHSGVPVCSNDRQGVLSSVITLEKVAIDKVTRDESNEVKKEAVDQLFQSPLELHKSLNHRFLEVEVGPFNLSLQKVVCDRFSLSDICRNYIEVVEKQLDVPGMSPSVRQSLMHQVIVWELIKVLFSEREASGKAVYGIEDNGEDMMLDGKAARPEVDPEALPLMRRAEFSYWLQDSVYHRVQEDMSCLSEGDDLQQIFLYLTGRQLDDAVELAASRRDVRLACLLGEAGGSMVNRSDVAQQLELWRDNGMDFNFIEKDRIQLYELLSGNIHSALANKSIDWKRFLGLLMWYELPPGTALPAVFHTYQHLLTEGKAPYPVPAYIDEGPIEETVQVATEGRYDLAYYLMLLHASDNGNFAGLKSMFSAFASTNDPLDHHMIWHQHGILEAIGAFSSSDLYILDMAYVSQLLCLGKCHWAIYVVLHMPFCEAFPYLHSTVIQEILFQYCETWSSQEEQRKFIEEMGVPSQWLHEALAVYFQYYGDLSKALEHYIKCSSWQKAHTIFITSVVHSLFLSAKDSEIWRLATSMEDYKSEIEDWDLGAGIYISFYLLRSSLHGDQDDINKLDSLESKEAACREFFNCLNKSLEVLGIRLPTDARVAYSKMSEEISKLLVSDGGEDSRRETQLTCFDTIAAAPIPEDHRSCHLQEAVLLFTTFLSETAT